MDDNQTVTSPYFLHEGDMARQERTIKRLWILCIILIFLLAGSTVFWVYRETQYEDVVTITQESSTEGGGNAVVNNGGGMIYGEGKANDNKNP